jgi:hypothetical protein
LEQPGEGRLTLALRPRSPARNVVGV